MNKVSRYKIWLREVSREFDVPQKTILSSKSYTAYVVCARKTFYWLCFKDKIDLYRLSERLGKDRTTVVGSLKNTRDRTNKETIQKIWNNVKTRESKEAVFASYKRNAGKLDKLVDASTK